MADNGQVTAYENRIRSSPFAVLATHGRNSQLDLVPCCFALDGSRPGRELVTAVDHKPKRSVKLARLANIARTPNVTLLVDHRDPHDWSQLWWVRVHGLARVVDSGPDWSSAIDALVEKYEHYRAVRPTGPAIRISAERWLGWIPERPDGGELDLEPT